jgi:hypothetical protein
VVAASEQLVVDGAIEDGDGREAVDAQADDHVGQSPHGV